MNIPWKGVTPFSKQLSFFSRNSFDLFIFWSVVLTLYLNRHDDVFFQITGFYLNMYKFRWLKSYTTSTFWVSVPKRTSSATILRLRNLSGFKSQHKNNVSPSLLSELSLYNATTSDHNVLTMISLALCFPLFTRKTLPWNNEHLTLVKKAQTDRCLSTFPWILGKNTSCSVCRNQKHQSLW